jgi:hypothetical protein
MAEKPAACQDKVYKKHMPLIFAALQCSAEG